MSVCDIIRERVTVCVREYVSKKEREREGRKRQEQRSIQSECVRAYERKKERVW